jgi:hypothetical protein
MTDPERESLKGTPEAIGRNAMLRKWFGTPDRRGPADDNWPAPVACRLERVLSLGWFEAGFVMVVLAVIGGGNAEGRKLPRLFGTTFAPLALLGKVTAILAETCHGRAVRQPGPWT